MNLKCCDLIRKTTKNQILIYTQLVTPNIIHVKKKVQKSACMYMSSITRYRLSKGREDLTSPQSVDEKKFGAITRASS